MRSVFLPESFAAEEVAKSWEIPQIAIVLLIWTVVGTLLALKTFRWSDK
jgi:ABC-2 type transport system permease protein